MATRNKIRLSEIVNDYMVSREHEDFDSHVSRQKVMLRAKQGLKHLTRRTGGNVKTVIVPVTSFSATLPPDFMDYVKIGFLDQDGQIVAFGRNDSLGISFELLTDNLGNNLVDQDGYYLEGKITRTSTPSASPVSWLEGGVWLNYHMGSEVYNAYGMQGVFNQYGTYRIDYENEFIEFSTDMDKTEIVLEYISDPTMADDPLIDQRLEDAIKAYIYWKNVERMSNVPDNHRMYARGEFYNEERKANHRIMTFTIYEAVKALKMGNKPIKF